MIGNGSRVIAALLAHDVHQVVPTKAMATKVKIMKMVQEIRGLAELATLQPAPKASTLYLMQLRSRQMAERNVRHHLAIRFDLNEMTTLPDPVKITFLPASK